MKIRKAIIPVAGFGTRFLPATKAQPKCMLTLIDTPVIQVIVEEAVASGIDQIIFITDHSKNVVEDHFDRNFELEWRLKEKGKDQILKKLLAISEMAQFAFIRQPNPNGDGHAILQAKDFIGDDEPVMVFYGDDLFYCEVPAAAQLMEVYEKYGDPVVGLYDVGKENACRFGVAKGRMLEDRLMKIEGYVEKPPTGTEPSSLAGLGRYVVTPELMNILKAQPPGKDGEVRLADAFTAYLSRGKTVHGRVIDGIHYDIGNKFEYAVAATEAALKHAEVNKDGAFAAYFKKRASEL